MKEQIAVIGAGAAGMTTAAWLTEKGYKVVLWDREEQCREDFEMIRQKGIRVDGPGFHQAVFPDELTFRIDRAMDARQVIVCVSAKRQRETAFWMSPWVRPEHRILLTPGNLGTVEFRRVFRQTGADCSILAELSECLWACRRKEPGETVSAMPMGEKRIAALPSDDTEKAFEEFKDLFPLKAGKNIIENSLNSPNVITHVAGTLLNLGGIAEKGKKFALFTDGLSDGYVRCMKILEAEREKVLTAMDMECFSKPVEPLISKLRDPQQYPELKAFRSLIGPDGLEHRFLEEDAACGTALLVSSAKAFGVEAPLAESLLTIAGLLTGKDYYRSGRTWEWLEKDTDRIL